MIADSKVARMVLGSPWFLLIFTVIPLSAVLNVAAHLQLPFVGIKQLLINNAAFALLVAVRFVRYLAGLRKARRYSASECVPRGETLVSVPVEEARTGLEKAGYAFSADGRYGEKRTLGYLGMTLFYGGLLLLMGVGIYDNLCQFSGTLLDAIGPPSKLNKMETYRDVVTGPLTRSIDSLPQMMIVNQFMPTHQYPHGATEIALMGADGQKAQKIVQPMEPFAFGDYDILMAKFLVEPQVTIRSTDGSLVYRGFVKLSPIMRKEGAYGFSAPFAGNGVSGLVYYRTDTNKLKVVMEKGGKWIFDTTLIFQVEQSKEKNGYILSCDRMGIWTEIHVVHRRHKALLIAAGIIALAGLLMRLALRPERVWLAEAAQGCRVRATGKETSKLVQQLQAA